MVINIKYSADLYSGTTTTTTTTTKNRHLEMDVTPWCYKWTDWIELSGWDRLGGVRYRAPDGAKKKNKKVR